MCQVYTHFVRQVKDAEFQQKIHYLDNKILTKLKELIAEEIINFQLVPPGNKTRNDVKTAVHMFKNHYTLGLATVS